MTTTPPRVRPRVWIGLAVYLAYTALVFVIQLASGVPYTDFGDSGSNLFFGAGLSLIIGAVFLAITTTLLGWWRPVLFDRKRSVRWPIIAPAIMVVAALLNLGATDWQSYDGTFLAASIVLLLVGFTEEVTTRGILLTGFRSRLSEGWVWFLTSLLFALMHLTNAFSGQPLLPTVQQVLFAFFAGTVFYIARRTTGSLVWAMVVHGLWDFSVFAVTHGTPNGIAVLASFLQSAAFLVAAVSVAFVIRGAQERVDGPRIS